MSAKLILHITNSEAWLNAVRSGEYRGETLESEGFLHCSTLGQIIDTAERHYKGFTDLILLCIDPQRLKAEMRYEFSAGGGGDFPHIYGPINLEAVRQAVAFPPTPDGGFGLPSSVEQSIVEPGIWVCATNQDDSPHWQHPALLAGCHDGMVVTRTGFGQQVAREDGAFTSAFDTRGHYWSDRWFNVIRLDVPGTGLDGFYCNVASPLRFDGQILSYVDLQLDVRVRATAGALSWSLLDEDEFESARQRFDYPSELVQHCHAAVDQIVRMVEAREFPFDQP